MTTYLVHNFDPLKFYITSGHAPVVELRKTLSLVALYTHYLFMTIY